MTEHQEHAVATGPNETLYLCATQARRRAGGAQEARRRRAGAQEGRQLRTH